jgi:hypothetical protein
MILPDYIRRYITFLIDTESLYNQIYEQQALWYVRSTLQATETVNL